MIGRPYSPTDLSADLIRHLGRTVMFTTDGEDRVGILANVHVDGTATITNLSDIVVAIVPVDAVRV